MHLQYVKFAVEVAACGSINKAAERLGLGQPNLSRAIKDLENSLGTELFERSVKGMKPTEDGEVFLRYAKSILREVDEIENMFNREGVEKKHFSISVPRASYIGEAFSNFSKNITSDADAELFYRETNALRAIKNILEEDYKLGIIRYAENYDKYYKTMLEEKGLAFELIAEFGYVLLMSNESPLANLDSLTYNQLENYIEIAHADPFVPSLHVSEVKKEELTENVRRRIFVFERASQLELLSSNPETFMWVSPLPDSTLSRYGLCQRTCPDHMRYYKDLMIYRKDYHLTDLDKQFIDELCMSRRRAMR